MGVEEFIYPTPGGQTLLLFCKLLAGLKWSIFYNIPNIHTFINKADSMYTNIATSIQRVK